MAASYAALQTTGHNIANANVGAYSRQSVDLATAPGQYSGAGFFGRGVEVSTVRRAHDSFLTNEANNSKALAAMDSAVLTQLRSLERAFQNGEGSIGDSISQLFAAFSDLSAAPTICPHARWCWPAPRTWPQASRRRPARLTACRSG